MPNIVRPWVELDTFASETDVMWRGFVASAIAAVALQYIDPFGTAKLVLFQVPPTKLLFRSSMSYVTIVL